MPPSSSDRCMRGQTPVVLFTVRPRLTLWRRRRPPSRLALLAAEILIYGGRRHV